METGKPARSVTLGLRTTPEVKAMLIELTEMLSESLGSRISQSQALEVAIREAVISRKKSA